MCYQSIANTAITGIIRLYCCLVAISIDESEALKTVALVSSHIPLLKVTSFDRFIAAQRVARVSSLAEGPVPLPHRPQATPPTVTTRSGRQVTPNRFYFNESHANTAYLDTFSPKCNDTSTDRSILQPDCERASEPHPAALMANHIFSFVSSASDPDTMTLDEAMRAPDRAEFIKAMHKELSDHIGRGHWKI
eukprot:scaffold114_cov69-Cylindrotheca_fusiformis.AAC.1